MFGNKLANSRNVDTLASSVVICSHHVATMYIIVYKMTTYMMCADI